MQRRKILKAAGATSALTLGSGVVTAQDDDTDDNGDDNGDDDADDNGQGQRECRQANCIHPTLGYAGLSPDENLPSPLQPDHEVNLLIRPPQEGSDRQVPEFFFEPTGLHINQGDVVRFNLATPDHTVTAYHPGFGRQRRVPEQVPPFSSPVLAGGTFWLYRFDQVGVYDVLCAPHEFFGMVGRVVVGDGTADWTQTGDEDADDTGATTTETETDDTGDDAASGGDDDSGEGQAGPPLRPPALTAALVYQDPALAVENIKDASQVRWDDLADESKQVLIELAEPEQ